MFSTVEINECISQPGSCSQVCENTRGSFICKCVDGYGMGTDRRTCKKKDRKNILKGRLN